MNPFAASFVFSATLRSKVWEVLVLRGPLCLCHFWTSQGAMLIFVATTHADLTGVFLKTEHCVLSVFAYFYIVLKLTPKGCFMESMGCFGTFPGLDPHLCDFWRSLHTFRKVPLGRNLFTTPMRLGIASLEGHVGVCTCNLSIGGIEHFLKWSIPRWKQLQYRWVAWVEVWRFRQVPGIGTNFVPWKDSVC